MKLQPKQEAFAVAVVKNGGDKVKAREEAGYSMRMNRAAQGVDADVLYNHPKISIRIKELQETARETAEASFKCTVESLVKELEEARAIALGLENPQTSAAIAATMGKAKIMGMDKLVIQAEVKKVKSFSDMYGQS